MQRKIRARASLASLTLLLSPALAFGDVMLPSAGPLPFSRPYTASGFAAIDNLVTTGSVSAYTAPATVANLVTGGSIAQLKSGLDALSSGSISRARQVRDSLPKDILMWAIAISGAEGVPSAEIAEAAKTLGGWPGMSTLRSNSELAMYKENPGPRAALAAFGNSKPQTPEGTILLARSHVAVGNLKEARAVLAPFWRTARLEAGHEQIIIREFGKILSAADHRARMERMLYNDRIVGRARSWTGRCT
jgi:soluble lytic murein transglycosylase